MRLKPFNANNIRVGRGSGGGGGMPGGKLGCGGIVVVLIGALIFGVDPAQMLGTMEGAPGGIPQQQQGGAGESAAEICDDNQYAMEACNALSNLDQTWAQRFQEAGAGDAFRQPKLWFYSDSVRSGCGSATSAAGPFYCPADEGIYIDTSFYDTMQRQLGAGGDFARYYVMAHEYAHHIQTVTGISDQIRSAQSQNSGARNRLQVMMELHADCYAGVWAGKNRNLIEPGDFEEGMNAAAAIGDDTLTGGRVSSENFTHGTSQQRMAALRLGVETADDDRCDAEILQAG